MCYKFTENSKKILNENKVVLGNIQTGHWVRISKEVYDILNLGIENKLSLDELKLSLYDNEDRDYIDSLYKKLVLIGIMKDKENKRTFQNKIASFEITHKCNLNCIHCCIDADNVFGNSKDLTTDEVEIILDKLIEWNPERIMLSGGEPMLRKDFLEILSYLHNRYDGEITVSTNGTLINKNNVKALATYAYQVDISLDGVNEETCSIVRGNGVFDKVVNNIRLLQDTGFKQIAVSMTVADRNEYLEDAFIKLNEELGTKPLIRMFTSIGRGNKNKKCFSDKTENEMYIPKKFLKKEYDKNLGIRSCNAGQREIFIDHRGNVYPCPSFIESKYYMGNILNMKGLSELDTSSTKKIRGCHFLKNYNPGQYKKCSSCKMKLFCWTCPGELYNLKENQPAIEYRCNKIKPLLYERVWER